MLKSTEYKMITTMAAKFQAQAKAQEADKAERQMVLDKTKLADNDTYINLITQERDAMVTKLKTVESSSSCGTESCMRSMRSVSLWT